MEKPKGKNKAAPCCDGGSSSSSSRPPAGVPLADLSTRFAQSLVDGCVCLSVGVKHGGKSTLMSAVLRCCMQLGTFRRLVLVLPVYAHEASTQGANTYSFIEEEAKHMSDDTEVLILDSFDDNICERLLAVCEADLKPTLVVIDDATFLRKLRYIGGGLESPMCKMFVTNRHLGPLTVWALVHSCSDVISPVLRDNLTYLVLHQLGSARIARMFWDEWLSVAIPKYDAFAATLRYHLTREYGTMMIATGKDPCIDLEVQEWEFLRPHIKFIVDLAERGAASKKKGTAGRRRGCKVMEKKLEEESSSSADDAA